MNNLIYGKWAELGNDHSYDGIFKTTLINEIKKIIKNYFRYSKLHF